MYGKKKTLPHVTPEKQRCHFLSVIPVRNALTGRGRKIGNHWAWPYPFIHVEFEQLRRGGVKLLLINTATTMVNTDPLFNSSYCFTTLVTPLRILDFTDRHNIAYRKLEGKKQVSDKKMACPTSTWTGEARVWQRPD